MFFSHFFDSENICKPSLNNSNGLITKCTSSLAKRKFIVRKQLSYICLYQNVFSLIRLEHLNVNSIIYSGFSVVANDPIFPSQAQWLFKVYEVKLATQKLHVI